MNRQIAKISREEKGDQEEEFAEEERRKRLILEFTKQERLESAIGV